MIEKIRTTEQGLYNEHGTFLGTMPKDTDSLTLANKINEVIDAINSIVSVQEKLIDSRFVVETKTDPYEEQKKWIGKACWFWDGNAQTKAFGQLNQIDPIDDGQHAPYQTNYGQWYEHCEPANDDIIYKGDNNE